MVNAPSLEPSRKESDIPEKKMTPHPYLLKKMSLMLLLLLWRNHEKENHLSYNEEDEEENEDEEGMKNRRSGKKIRGGR